MKVVIDCNVLFSAAWNDGISRRVVLRVVETCNMIVSPLIAAEYRRIGDRHGSPERRDVYVGIVSIILQQATMVADAPCPFELPDPDDLPYAAAAFNSEADAIVTGNRKHFPHTPYGGVRVLTVRELADELGITS